MALDPSQALFTRDFFFEVMKDTQRLRAGYLAERERWLRGLALDGREEILFEFEMLMRGLERYFNVHNLPLDARANLVGRDFRGELRAVRDALARTVHLTQFLLDPPSERNLVFRKYLESQIVDDRARGQLLEQQLTQETPQESLFLLRSGLSALKGVIDGLLRLPQVSDQLFRDLGQVLVREIALNKYFRPFRPLEFRSEYDRIKSVRILELLGRLEAQGEAARRAASLAFLALFRLLHYLRYVQTGAGDAARRGYLVMSLVRSESTALAAYLENDLASSLPPELGSFAQLAVKVAVELKKEVQKALRKHLAGAAPGDPEPVAKARESLQELFKQWVVALAQGLEPGVKGEELFDDYVSRREQAKRLRVDLFVFRDVCRKVEKLASKDGEAHEEIEKAVRNLKRFIGYFRDVSYQLLRYGDYEPFDDFISIVRDLDPGRLRQNRARRLLAEDCRAFEEALSRIFSAVGKREELAKAPFDESDARATIAQLGLA